MIALNSYTVDYMRGTSERVVQYEVQRLYQLLADIKRTGRICNEAGHRVVAEFNVRGNPEKIVTFLEDHIATLKCIRELTKNQRIGMLMRIAAGQDAVDHLNTQSDIHLAMMREMFDITEDINDIDAMAERYNNNKDTLHNSRECLCHCNH